MDKDIIIAGLRHWRTNAKKRFYSLETDADIRRILELTSLDESDDVASLGEKFQLCLREFLLVAIKTRSINTYKSLLSLALETGYEVAGARRGTGVDKFLRYVVARDKLIGLEAGGEKINDDEFTYWITDMFLPLCRERRITPEDYESISTNGYLRTKINYFLPDPDNWAAEMTISPFQSDRTEWKIYKKDRSAITVRRVEEPSYKGAMAVL